MNASICGFSLISTALTFSLGCGGEASNVSPTTLPTATASAVSTPAPPSTRGPSDALVRAWPGGKPKSVLYADADGLVHSPVVAAIWPVLLDNPFMPKDEAACIRDLALATHEVLAGETSPWTVVARMDKPTPALRACIDVLHLAHVRYDDDGLFVMAPGAPSSEDASELLRSLKLTGDERVVMKQADGTEATLALSDGHVGFHSTFDTKDEAEAASTTKFLTTNPSVAFPTLKPDERALLDRLAKGLVVKHDGRHMDVTYELREPAADQARDVGALAATFVHGVQEYMLAVKRVEAELNVVAIAHDMKSAWEAEPPPGTKRPTKLKSLAPVPKDVPRGVKYVSKPDEWKAWDAIKFSLDAPQYYQYSVKAAPDGQSADVIAQGDLNGDGKVSTYKITIKIDPTKKSLVIGPMQKTDPNE